MARQERPFGGINILGLITTERPQGVGAPTLPPPTREAPPPPVRRQNGLTQTLKEAVAQDSRGTAEKPKRNIPLKIAASLGALAAVATAAWGIEKSFSDDQGSSPTPQTRNVDSFNNSFNPKEGEPALVETKQVNPKEIFDPYAERGVIKDSNILRGVSLQAIQEAPMFDEEGNPLLLITTPKEGEESPFERKLVAPGVLPHIVEEAKAKNVKDQWSQKVKANTPIPMPTDGYVFLIIVERPNQSILAGVKVVFMTPNNTLDFINISTNDTRAEFLINAPKVSPENSYGKDYTKGLFFKRGEQNLYRPLVDGNINYLRQSGEGGTLATNRRIPGNIIPLTIADPLTGEAKLPAQ